MTRFRLLFARQLLGRCGLCQLSGLDTIEEVVVDQGSLGAKDRPAPVEPAPGCSIRGLMARYKTDIFYNR